MTYDEAIRVGARVLVALPIVLVIGVGAGALLEWLVGEHPRKERP